jgi:hypothetical protein
MAGTDRPLTTLDHLRSLVEASGPRGACCTACDADDYIVNGHRPDCRWEAAKAHVEQEDAVARHLDGNNPKNWATCFAPKHMIATVSREIHEGLAKGEVTL